MESLKEYKMKRLRRELEKYKNLYDTYFEENYKQKILLNTMAQDNANLKRQIVELQFNNNFEKEKLKEDSKR